MCGPKAVQRVAARMSPGLRPPPLFRYATHCAAFGKQRWWFLRVAYQLGWKDQADGALSVAA
jgi:hypothetical protein